jgi:hypothetical protein
MVMRGRDQPLQLRQGVGHPPAGILSSLDHDLIAVCPKTVSNTM